MSGGNRHWLAAEGRARTTVRPVRLVIGLAATSAICFGLVVIDRLGASWPVGLAATMATTATVAWAGGGRARALLVLLVVGLGALGYLKALDVRDFGTLSLHGPPPRIRWCADWFEPSGAVAHGLAQGDAPPFRQILTTPAGLGVFGSSDGKPAPLCGPTGPLYVQTSATKFLIYNP